jgi:hypothetical protein
MYVHSAAECLARCRDDEACAYAAFSSTAPNGAEGKFLCRWSSERQCTLRPVRDDPGFDTYYCPKNRTKRCNYNLVVATDNVTVAGPPLPPLSSAAANDDSLRAVLDCEWSYDHVPQQRRGFVVEAGVRFTLRNIVIRRCRAGCGPPFYSLASTFDVVFSSLLEAIHAVDAPSRVLCSGGGLAAKAGTRVSLWDVTFDRNRGREGGGIAMVGGAVGDWRDVTFVGNTADAGGALLVTSGSTLTWQGGSVESNCARSVEAAAVEISGDGTTANLVKVSVVSNLCDVESTCWRKREHAYRGYLCRTEEENLQDEANVRLRPLSSCVEVAGLMASGEYQYGMKSPRPAWSSFVGDREIDLLPATDCVGQVDVPHGIRVTGSVPGRSLVGNGNFDGGLPLEGESDSWMSHGERNAARVSNQQFKTSEHKGFQKCPRGWTSCFGRTIVPIDDGPEKGIDHAIQFRLPSNLQGRTMLGEYDVRVPIDAHLQARGVLRVGFWYRCSSGYVRDYENWEIFASNAYYTTGTYTAGAPQIYKRATVNLGASGGPRCKNQWVRIDLTFDETAKRPPTRRFRVFLAYPLQQTEGTLQITGVKALFSSSSTSRAPALRCYGCRLSSNAGHDLRTSDNVSSRSSIPSSVHLPCLPTLERGERSREVQ